jgi:D-alanyl-D-alanine carboxypeptidase (penicillin-binding protein 5/6)
MTRKVKNIRKGRLMAFLLIVAIAALVYINPGNHHIFETEYDDETWFKPSLGITPDWYDDRTKPAAPSIEPDSSVLKSSDRLNSSNAILVRLKDQTILMQKNSEEKIYPASLTKMMTAIVAIENLPDLKEEIKLTNSTFEGLFEAGASMAGFQPGEKVRAIDLLYGAMLPSGAECCIGLADHIAGSEQTFAKIMNQRAEDLGMVNTHFENTTGLHHENHYTTVKDLAILLTYALQNNTFQEVFTSSRHSTRPTNIHPEGITFYSTMSKGLSYQNIIGGKILGGKTGYTDEAGLCLASLAQVGNQEYVLVTAGAKGDNKYEQYHITDALAVYNSLIKQHS